jgi:hypothetical protein
MANKIKNIPGYIYCLYNPMFNYYGNNVYKLGQTANIKTRLNSYVTSYIDKPEYLLVSKLLINKKLAEDLLFVELDNYRICSNREFFKCDINIIKNAFELVESIYLL